MTEVIQKLNELRLAISAVSPDSKLIKITIDKTTERILNQYAYEMLIVNDKVKALDVHGRKLNTIFGVEIERNEESG